MKQVISGDIVVFDRPSVFETPNCLKQGLKGESKTTISPDGSKLERQRRETKSRKHGEYRKSHEFWKHSVATWLKLYVMSDDSFRIYTGEKSLSLFQSSISGEILIKILEKWIFFQNSCAEPARKKLKKRTSALVALRTKSERHNRRWFGWQVAHTFFYKKNGMDWRETSALSLWRFRKCLEILLCRIDAWTCYFSLTFLRSTAPEFDGFREFSARTSGFLAF